MFSSFLHAVLIVVRVGGLTDLYVEPLGLEAQTDVPIYISFSTGPLPVYGRAVADEKTLLSLQFEHVKLGKDGDCRQILEAPRIPPLQSCSHGTDGELLLELRGVFEKSARYDLLVLGTMPAAGMRLRWLVIRVLQPDPFAESRNSSTLLVEEASMPILPEQLVVEHTEKYVTAFEIVSPMASQHGVVLQQFTFSIAGSPLPFAAGDQLRIFSSPLIHEDEGFSFGGPCDGFDVSGFASPLEDCSCAVTSVPAEDARVGHNVLELTLGASAILGEAPQYFRVAVNTPKKVGSFGPWYVASKDAAQHQSFDRVISGVRPFLTAPRMSILPLLSPSPASPAYGAPQQLVIHIFPHMDILGSTSAPPRITVTPPTFHKIVHCRHGTPSLGVSQVGEAPETAQCILEFNNDQNLYAHQFVSIELEAVNPTFAVGAEDWLVVLEDGGQSLIASSSFLGWPVHMPLREAFITPMTMQYGKWNELQLFFSPATTSPAEPRLVVVAPRAFSFVDVCDFQVVLGFPRQGVQCSTPLSELGRNLFSLRLPTMTVFEAGRVYAVRIYPLRNPHQGSHLLPVDSLLWRVDIVAGDGSAVLETARSVPMGPKLSGFQVYPESVFDGSVIPSSRTPLSENMVTLQCRVGLTVALHGERVLITAPFGYQWKVGAALHAFSGDRALRLVGPSHDAASPPPGNQVELTLVEPDVPAGADLTVQGVVWNAAVDPDLNIDGVSSANVWIVEMYEPGAGRRLYEHRHQAGVIAGFSLKAITGGSVTAWLPISGREPTLLAVTFRLGTSLFGRPGHAAMLEITAPEGFTFSAECRAEHLSPLHLPVDGFSALPPSTLATCRGESVESDVTGRVAQLVLADGAALDAHLLYAMLLETATPHALPHDNTWSISSVVDGTAVEEQRSIAGFRLATAFLSVVYLPGSPDSGEDLRVGASDNRVMFGVQLASKLARGGTLRITAPHGFLFAQECQVALHTARHVVSALWRGDMPSTQPFRDLPVVRTCHGMRNMATLTFGDALEVALRYVLRVAASNPVLPHPDPWPLEQSVWRFETFDALEAPLNAAEVRAFRLWSFVRASVTPLSVSAAAQSLLTLDLKTSLTVPARGALILAAPLGFGIPVPCSGFQRDTHSGVDGIQPLPPGVMCGRGPGGDRVARLSLDERSALAAGVHYRCRLAVVHPPRDDTRGDEAPSPWSLASVEAASGAEVLLEWNPAVEGYRVAPSLGYFSVRPDTRLSGERATVTFAVEVHELFGLFEVVTTAEASYALVVDMPLYFSVPVIGGGAVLEVAGHSKPLQRCEGFSPIYPGPPHFPVDPSDCFASDGEPRFWLPLTRSLRVGPTYMFDTLVLHPVLTSRQREELASANLWRARFVGSALKEEAVTLATQAVAGYEVVPLLQQCALLTASRYVSVLSEVRVSVFFRTVTPLSLGTSSDQLRITPPPSISTLAALGHNLTLCQLWVSLTLQTPAAFGCSVLANGLVLQLWVPLQGSSEVQVDFEVFTGSTPLSHDGIQNRWSLTSTDSSGTVKDQMPRLPGFAVFSAVEQAFVTPKDTSAMSFVNHAEFRFRATGAVEASSYVVVVAPPSFSLYTQTFHPTSLPGAGGFSPPRALPGRSDGEAIIALTQPLRRSEDYSFLLTVGNPVVSPSQNEWSFIVLDAANATLCVNTRIPGFLVRSHFNTSLVSGQIDEPLAENYVHIAVAVNRRLVATASSDPAQRTAACTSSEDGPAFCSHSRGPDHTFLVVRAPGGFSFQDTCGFWTLSRVGSRHGGLPPGSLCRADPVERNVAFVQLALSLEALRIYEFTLQVRNALSMPLDNSWHLDALQNGVLREESGQVKGFQLRQMRSVHLVPSTTLAGAADNVVTVQLRSERPVTRGSTLLVVAPAGFALGTASVTASFAQPVTAEMPDVQDPRAVRITMSPQDAVLPNVPFFVTIPARNPQTTPDPNVWSFFLQSQFMEHIDLRTFFPGFAMAQRMLQCHVHPNTLPWTLGTPNDVSVLFVTRHPVFAAEDAAAILGLPTAVGAGGADASGGSGWGSDHSEHLWQVVLVAPVGFTFPRESAFSDRCSGFRRWGGKDTYNQLPDDAAYPLTCTVRTVRSAQIKVSPSIVNETRYSFRIEVTTAQRRSDVALEDSWRLTVLEGGQIVHLGESPSPLLDTFYVPEWLWLP